MPLRSIEAIRRFTPRWAVSGVYGPSLVPASKPEWYATKFTVWMALRHGPDVVGRSVRRAEREPLVGADRWDPEIHGLPDEALAEVTAVPVVEPPHVAVPLEGTGEVRERLPRGDRIAAG